MEKENNNNHKFIEDIIFGNNLYNDNQCIQKEKIYECGKIDQNNDI